MQSGNLSPSPKSYSTDVRDCVHPPAQWLLQFLWYSPEHSGIQTQNGPLVREKPCMSFLPLHKALIQTNSLPIASFHATQLSQLHKHHASQSLTVDLRHKKMVAVDKPPEKIGDSPDDLVSKLPRLQYRGDLTYQSLKFNPTNKFSYFLQPKL